MLPTAACQLIFAWILQGQFARDVFIFGRKREEWKGEWGEENMAQTIERCETASELKNLLTINLSSRRLYQLQAKIGGHTVYLDQQILVRWPLPGWTNAICALVDTFTTASVSGNSKVYNRQNRIIGSTHLHIQITLSVCPLWYRVFIKYCVFSKIFIKIPDSVFSRCQCVCTHTRQVEHKRCSRNGRVQKIKKKN